MNLDDFLMAAGVHPDQHPDIEGYSAGMNPNNPNSQPITDPDHPIWNSLDMTQGQSSDFSSPSRDLTPQGLGVAPVPAPDPNAMAAMVNPPAPAGTTPPAPAAPAPDPNAPPAQGGDDGTVQGTPKAEFQGPHGFKNILGILGDAFLSQGGAALRYQPAVQQAREAFALRNYEADPKGAMSEYSQVVPGAQAIAASNTTADNQRADVAQQSLLDQVAAGKKNAAIAQIRNVANKALTDPGNYPAYQAAMNQIATRAGLSPDDIKIPTSFDAAALKGTAAAEVPVEKQDIDASKQAYYLGRQQALLEQAAMNRNHGALYAAQAGQGGFRPQAPQRPRTVDQTVAGIKADLAAGRPVTPAAQNIVNAWDAQHTRAPAKAGGGGAGFSMAIGPDGRPRLVAK